MLKKCFSNKKFVVGFIILVPLIIVMIFGNFLVPNDPYALDTVNMLKNSSAKYPLGTDEYGRCILTRLILGIRPSMMVAWEGRPFHLREALSWGWRQDIWREGSAPSS